jgi:hypothetical protein
LHLADVESLLASFLPLCVRLPGEGRRQLEIGEARSLALVPGVGLRVDTSAHIQWEALGIGIPLTVRSLTALFRPHIVAGGSALAFGVAIEQADLAGMPAFMDQTIIDKANEALARIDLAWSFGKTLGRPLPLPLAMSPVSRVSLGVSGSEVVVTSEGLSLSVDLDASVSRDRPFSG